MSYSDLINEIKYFDNITKINRVNKWVNRFPYAQDVFVYGVTDYWANIDTFLTKGMGDCDDFALAKYYILSRLGVKDLRVEIVNKIGMANTHMICVAEGLVLDDPQQNLLSECLPYDRTNYLKVQTFDARGCIADGINMAKWYEWKNSC
jgi:predicted transglutaminase-like cysteine proteinase